MFCIRMDFIKFIILLFIFCGTNLFGLIFFDKYNAAKAYHEKNYDEAENKYKDLLINDPNNIDYLYNIANVFYEKKNYQNAKKYYEKVVKLNLDNKYNEQVYFNYGCCLFQLNALNESLSQFENVLKINPDNKKAKDNADKIK